MRPVEEIQASLAELGAAEFQAMRVWMDAKTEATGGDIFDQAEYGSGILQALFEHNFDGVVITSPDGRIHAANEQACRNFGWTEEEIRQVGRAGLVDPQDHRMADILEGRTRDGKARGEVRCKRKDGTLFTAELTSTAFKDSSGAERMISVFRDVTEQRAAEEALRARARFRQGLLDALPTHVAVLDEMGRIVAVNESWNQFARENGGKEETLSTGANYLDVCRRAINEGDKSAASALEGLERILKGVQPRFSFEYPCHAPGRERWFVMEILRAPQIDGIVVVHTDVTERKLTERALEQSEKRMLMEGVRDSAIFMLSPEGSVLTWNAGAKRLEGYEANEIVGKHFSSFYPPEDIANDVPGKALAKAAVEGVFETEGLRVRKDGSRYRAIVVTTALRDESGKLIGFAKVIRDITERKLAEKQIAFQASLLDQVRNAVVATDLGGKVIYWNTFAENLYQWKREEVMGRSIVELNLPEEAGSEASGIMETVRRDGFWEGELTVKRKDGSRFPAYVVDTLMRDERGQPASIIGVSVDASERKRSEAALRESEERYRTMIEYSNDLIWTLDTSGRFTFTSKRCEEASGYRFEDFQGRSFTPLVIEEDLPRVLQHFHNVLAGHPQRYEARVKRADGSIFAVAVNAAPIWKDGRITGSVAFGRDVTQEKEAESALRANEERFRLVTLATNDGIWDYDVLNGVVWWNDRFDELFGPGPADSAAALDWWIEALFPEDREQTAASFKAALDDSVHQWSCEYRFIRPDKRIKYVYDRAYIVRDPLGRAIRVVGAMLDMTERLQAQETLRRLSAQLLNLQEEERRRIARELHDSTTQKLVGMIMNLGLLEDSLLRSPERVQRLALECRKAAEDCAQETRTIAHLLHPPLLDELGLEVALDTFIAGFSRRSGIQVTLEIDPSVDGLSKEVALALFRIAQESLSNIVRHSQSPSALVQLVRVRDRVILEIADYGRGIPPEMLARFRESHADLGVGIMGMRERLEQLGGTLEIDSSPRGTTIRAIMPVQQSQYERSSDTDRR